MRDFVAISDRYARQVVDGSIPACTWTIKAAQRQLDDMAHGGDRELRFNRDEANRVCTAVELLPHVEGEWAKRGELLHLEPWQAFGLTAVFGWQKVRRKPGRSDRWARRFRTIYEEVARKNGKSAKMAAVSLIMLALDGEEGAQVLSAATTKDQASIVFATGWKMAQRSEEFREHYGVTLGGSADRPQRVFQQSTGSHFRPLTGENLAQEGLNPHLAVVDELHAHKTRAIYDVLELGMGAREQPLLWAITTAGADQGGICFDTREYLTQVLNGILQDDSVFGVIYTAEDEKRWEDEKQWRMANPNLGVSVQVDGMRDLARKASMSPSALTEFKIKRLNLWVSVASAWMNMDLWHACRDSSLRLADFEGAECHIGLDLAAEIDIAEVVLLFPKGEKVYAFGQHYLPKDRITESGKNSIHYQRWADEGRLIITPGSATSFAKIEQDLRSFASRFDVRYFLHDPWQAKDMMQRLTASGLKCVQVPQRTETYSPAMKRIEAMVADGKFSHPEDPVADWMVSNVIVKPDARDNVFPKKQERRKKIDYLTALLTGIQMLLTEDRTPKRSYYDDHEVETWG